MCSKIVNLEMEMPSKNYFASFEVIEGINYGILFTKPGKTRDLIFYDNLDLKVEISDNNSTFHEIETQTISNIKRIILN